MRIVERQRAPSRHIALMLALLAAPAPLGVDWTVQDAAEADGAPTAATSRVSTGSRRIAGADATPERAGAQFAFGFSLHLLKVAGRWGTR